MSICPHKDAGERCQFHNPAPVPEITKGGIVERQDGRSARVTSVRGRWGYWDNGTRTEPFESREAAAQAFVAAAGDVEARR